MKYRFLSEIGQHYEFEKGTPGLRTNLGVWRRMETPLKAAIMDLRNMVKTPTVAPVVAPFGNSVKDMIKFHNAVENKYAPQLALGEVWRKVNFFRQWLDREGVKTDKDGNIITHNLGALKVVYDKGAERQGMTKIHFTGGRLFTDAAFQKPLDTREMVTHFSGPGKAIYVMSNTGNIHVSSHVVGHRHHSSLLAGNNVACAGELKTVDGILVWLSNKSGHYMPKVTHLIQILHQFQKKKVPMTFPLVVMSKNGPENFNSVGDFLETLKCDPELDFEFMKLMRYPSEALQNESLSDNDWRWRNNALETPGVYDEKTNRKVPHRTVRKWLKSIGKVATDEFQSGGGR